MRFTPIAASAVIALGALAGFTTSSGTHTPETVQQRTVAVAPVADGVPTATVTGDNNGNG